MSAAKFIGFLIAPHIEECFMFNSNNDERNPWCSPDTGYAQPIGHKERKYLMIFRCADPDCDARLGVYPSQFYALIYSAMMHLRDKGKPNKARGQQ